MGPGQIDDRGMHIGAGWCWPQHSFLRPSYDPERSLEDATYPAIPDTLESSPFLRGETVGKMRIEGYDVNAGRLHCCESLV
jgi:hypothetical protein